MMNFPELAKATKKDKIGERSSIVVAQAKETTRSLPPKVESEKIK